MSVKKIVIICLVVVFGVTAGIVSGKIWASKAYKAPTPGIAVGDTDIGMPPIGKKKPDAFTAIENYHYAKKVLNEAKNVKSEITGKVNPNMLGVIQDVATTKYFDGEKVFSQYETHSSMAHVSARIFFDIQTQNVFVKEDSKKQPTWAEKYVQYSLNGDKGFIEKYGSSPRNFIPYIISSETVTNNGGVMTKEGDNYVLSFEFDAKKATRNYVRHVKNMSGSSQLPEFLELKAKIYIDENWNITKMETTEKYKIAILGFTPTCDAQSTELFYINQGKGTLPEGVNP